MRREDCHVGMNVVFGRNNGEQTHGIIQKLNLKTAKIVTSEARGFRHTAGAIWNVGYNLLRPAGEQSYDAPRQTIDPADAEFQFSIFQSSSDRHLMLALVSVYADLSPENLTCDGELPPTQIRQRAAELHRKQKGIFQALGRPVSESAAWKWYEQYQLAEKKENNHAGTN